MRQLTDAQRAALSCRAGYSRRARVRLLGPGSTWWDCTRLPVGDRVADFLEEVSVDDALDSPTAQARVRLRRQVLLASLSPLQLESPLNHLGGGYEPLVRSGRPVVVDVAVCPLGQQPREADWAEVLRGRVDTPSDAGDSVEFVARDYAGLLQDTFIEEERTYSSEVGTPVEDVMRALLQDNGQGALGLVAPESPDWAVGPFKQKKEPVLEALRALAGQLGADVKYRWSDAAGGFALTLYLPERDATEPAWTYGPGDYTALPEVEFPWEDVRTAVTGWYSDSQDKDAAGQPKVKRVDRDAGPAALQAYGRRWMELRLSATDNVDTQPEMERLLERAMADLGQPPLGVSVEVPLHPFLQLGDLVRLAPNGVQYSGEQTAAVVQLTHTFSRDVAKTRLTLRGKPALAPRVWLEKETGRPGAPPAQPSVGPRPPAVSAVQSLVSGLAVTLAPDARGTATAAYELHLSTQPGFTPDTDYPSATLKQVSSSTRLELSGLQPGVQHYARVVARDTAGNRSVPSAEFAFTSRYLSPGALSKLVSFGTLPLNGDFEAQADPDAPPDGSYMAAGTWGVDGLVVESISYSGTRCLRLVANGSRLALQAFVVRPGERFALKALAFSPTSGTVARLTVVWLDKSLAPLETASVASDYLTAGAWTALQGYLTVPAAARVARVEVGTGNFADEAYVYFDSVVMDPALTVVPAWNRPRHPSLGGSVNDYYNGWAPDTARPPRWRMNALGEVEWQGSVTGSSPGLAFALVMPAPAGVTTPDFPARFRVPAGASGEATVSFFLSANKTAMTVTGNTTQVCLDGVRYPVA